MQPPFIPDFVPDVCLVDGALVDKRPIAVPSVNSTFAAPAKTKQEFIYQRLHDITALKDAALGRLTAVLEFDPAKMDYDKRSHWLLVVEAIKVQVSSYDAEIAIYAQVRT